MPASILRHLTRRTTLAAAGLLLASTLTSAWAQTTQRVRLDTDMGSITLELDAAKAPITVRNFVQYVRDGHYDGTVFHRVIPDFMIQGGGFTPAMAQKPTREPIAIESRNGLRNVRGTIAMARTMVPDSATAQFFINVKDNDFLDQANSRDGHGYAVFGRVVAGMDVVDRIRQVPTGNRGGHQNVPLQPVTILKATLEN
jgi:peptidyl-prolyl cis-trans isomerase A (cyclophilin A)